MTKPSDAAACQILPAAYSHGFAQVRHVSGPGIAEWAIMPISSPPCETAIAPPDTNSVEAVKLVSDVG
jgi:hypothetical protein